MSVVSNGSSLDRDFESLVEHAPDAIARFDREFRHVYVNRAAERMMGLDRARLIGRTHREVGAAAAAGCPEEWEGLLGRCLARPGEYTHEFALAGPTGRRRYQVRVAPQRAADGSVRSVLAFARDVTDLHATRAQHAEGERRLRVVFERAVDAIFLVGDDGRVTDANPAASELTGMTHEQLVGRHVYELVDACAVPCAKDGHRGDLFRDDTRTGEVPIRRPDGRLVWVEYSARAGLVPGCNLIMLHDVTERRRAAETAARLAAVVDSSHDAILSLDLDGRIVDWNASAELIYGYTAAEVAGHTPAMFVPPDRVGECERILGRVLAGERVERVETVRVRKDGRAFDASITVSPVRDPAGRIVGFSAIVRDVTRLKEAQAAVGRSEARFRAFMDNSPAVAFMKDEAGRYVYLNAACRERMLAPGQDWIGKTSAEVFPPAVAAQLGEDDRAVVRGRRVTELVETVPDRDGRPRSWLVYKFPFQAATGQSYLAGQAVDITDRVEAERALRDTTRQLQAITRAMTAFLGDGDWRRASAALLAAALRQTDSQFGFVGAVVGRSLRVLAHEGVVWSDTVNRPFYERALRTYAEVGYLEFPLDGNLFGRVVGTGESILSNDVAADPRARGALPPGHPPLRQFLGVPIVNGRDVVGVIGVANRSGGYGRAEQEKIEILTGAAGVLYDSYRRREREVELNARRLEAERVERERNALRDAVAAMDQVMGVVGHELRTPLASLRVMSEFLLADGARETAEFDGFVRAINAEVVRMACTVDNLLEAARLDSGRAKWNWTEFELARVCESAIESIRPLVDPSRVGLSLRVEPPSLAMRGDADAVRRLVMNLLSNAHKHTAEGSISVSVRRPDGRLGGDGRHLEIEVRDTGSGIPDEIRARLGEAFALNAGMIGRTYVAGSGLGLAICKGIVAAHGGTLGITSAVGQGTAVSAGLRTDLHAPAKVVTAPSRTPVPSSEVA